MIHNSCGGNMRRRWGRAFIRVSKSDTRIVVSDNLRNQLRFMNLGMKVCVFELLVGNLGELSLRVGMNGTWFVCPRAGYHAEI